MPFQRWTLPEVWGLSLFSERASWPTQRWTISVWWRTWPTSWSSSLSAHQQRRSSLHSCPRRPQWDRRWGGTLCHYCTVKPVLVHCATIVQSILCWYTVPLLYSQPCVGTLCHYCTVKPVLVHCATIVQSTLCSHPMEAQKSVA